MSHWKVAKFQISTNNLKFKISVLFELFLCNYVTGINVFNSVSRSSTSQLSGEFSSIIKINLKNWDSFKGGMESVHEIIDVSK